MQLDSRLLFILVNNHRRFTKKELAERLDTTVRSIERCMVRLEEVGFTFDACPGEVALNRQTKVYDSLSRLVYFSEDEAATLYSAIEAIETNSQAKEQLRSKLASIYSTRGVKEKIMRLQKSQCAKDLIKAIEGRRRVILKNYSSPSSRTTFDRLVEPFQLTDGCKQVWCYEIASASNKIFNVSRIEAVEILQDQPWQCSMRHQEGYTDAFRNISPTGNTFHVKVRMGQMAYSLMVEEYPLTQKDITKTGEAEWTYEAEVSSYRGIGRFVIGLADCIEVDTPELRSYMENFANLYLRGR